MATHNPSSSSADNKQKRDLAGLQQHLFTKHVERQDAPWSDVLEQEIVAQLEKLKGFRWCYLREYEYNRAWVEWCMLIGVFLTFISSIINAITAFQAKSTLDKVVGLTTFCCTVFTTLLLGISKGLKFSDKADHSLKQATSCISFQNSLETMLKLPRLKRRPALHVIMETNNQLTAVTSKSNGDIRKSTLKLYEKMFPHVEPIGEASLNKPFNYRYDRLYPGHHYAYTQTGNIDEDDVISLTKDGPSRFIKKNGQDISSIMLDETDIDPDLPTARAPTPVGDDHVSLPVTNEPINP